MGMYLNPGNKGFTTSLNSEIYVDKSLLIEYTNKVINTNNKNICVSRPRRFGKSTDAQMLCAYYDSSCDSSSLFQNLNISKSTSYYQHLNKHQVISLDMQKFLSESHNIDAMIKLVNDSLIWELLQEYDVNYFDKGKLSRVLGDIYVNKKVDFIFIIDEWDCIFREFKDDKEAQERYLDFLRLLFKGQNYVSMVYMTGILPIKKYGTHSALNMFDEFSMISSKPLTSFMGFTEHEVTSLCNQFHMDDQEMQNWYNGYHLEDNLSIYSPKSVVSALQRKNFQNYWSQTETYEALKIYIDLNYDGLKDTIINLLTGQHIYIETGTFQNDMTSFKSKDDILTLLVHLGYLGYDNTNKEVYIPNREVTDTFISSIKDSDWGAISNTLRNSQNLLLATWKSDEERVAKAIEQAHLETSILQYNDENALAYTIYLAYITARNQYTIIRELPSGKGFADLVFLPLYDKPALLIELKWNQDADTAIKQIKEKRYDFGLEKYKNNLLLVGINYDIKTKIHTCTIEKYLHS